MSISAFSGPVISFGQAPFADYNPELGPSLFYAGAGLLDPRPFYTYEPGQASGNVVAGFLGITRILTVNQVPSTLSATNIALAQAPTAGTALTLTAGTGVTGSVTITSASTNSQVTGLLALDGAAGRVSYGSVGTIQLWDPTKALSRNVRITSVGNDSSATFTVKGYDIYGYPMTETITGANAGIASGAKAWKYIASITPAGTLSGSNVSVGTGDVYGFPIYSASFNPGADADVSLCWAGAAITSATGYTAGVTTTATATTGDVRGTYATQSASNNSNRLLVTQSPSLANISSVTGLFGVTQF
jgi:hypothetical protein